MKELSQDQINRLFEFVESKNVPHIDTRCEIVDHLASAIEELQSQDPSLSFESALNKVYKRFPITGFASMQLEKEKILKKFWRGRFWSYVLKFMSPPRVILSITLYLGFSFLFNQIGDINLALDKRELAYLVLGPISTVLIIKEFLADYNVHNKKRYRSAYLVIDTYMLQSFRLYVLFVGIPLLMWVIFPGGMILQFTGYLNYLLSFLCTSSIIFFYAHKKAFPNMLKEEIDKKYAHLNIKLA